MWRCVVSRNEREIGHESLNILESQLVRTRHESRDLRKLVGVLDSDVGGWCRELGFITL